MEKILIWGTGYIAEQVFRQCDVFGLYDVAGFIDNNPAKRGQLFYGREVFSPEILREIIPDRIVALTVWDMEIKEQILRDFPEVMVPVENRNFFYKQSILKRYESSHDPEILQILGYLRRNDLQVFNYEFVKKYQNVEFNIQYDRFCEMYFVYHGCRRLYFARWLKDRGMVEDYYKGILLEQDQESPHRYIGGDFNVKDGDIVVDAGAAEGFFSLQVVDRASRLYIIETDEAWIEALRETFKDYMDKVVIIKSFITSLNEGKNATLDMLIQEPVNFIKMDIEGSEWDALLGAEELIARSEDLKCAICAYHGDFDEVLIKDTIMKYGMECSVTKGYMWYPDVIRQTYVSTRLCRGIVRGMKCPGGGR